MKPNFNLKFDVFLNTLFGNWNIENMYSSHEDDIFPTQIKVRRIQTGNNVDAVLNDFTDLESEIFLQYFSG